MNDSDAGSARVKEIIVAARELFSNQGYQQTSMRNVVQKAGTSIGNLYFYFSNKAELLKAVVEHVLDQVWEHIEAEIRDIPYGARQLAVSTRILVNYICSNQKLAQLILVESSMSGVKTELLQKHLINEQKLLAVNTSELGALDSYLAALAWQGSMVYIIEHIVSDKAHRNIEDMIDFGLDWNLRALGFSQEVVDDAISYSRGKVSLSDDLLKRMKNRHD